MEKDLVSDLTKLSICPAADLDRRLREKYEILFALERRIKFEAKAYDNRSILLNNLVLDPTVDNALQQTMIDSLQKWREEIFKEITELMSNLDKTSSHQAA